MKPSGIEPATVRLVAQCLNQLRHLLPGYDMYECINWRVTFWNRIYRGKGSASVCSKHTAKSFHKYPFTSVGSTKYSSGSGQKEVEWKSSERESNASCRDSPASRKLRHPNVPVSRRVLFSIFLSTWFHLCQVSGFTDRLFPFLPMSTWCVQVLRSPNLLRKNYSTQEAENAVISQRNHPVDIYIFHNAHATIAWPQQTLL